MFIDFETGTHTHTHTHQGQLHIFIWHVVLLLVQRNGYICTEKLKVVI